MADVFATLPGLVDWLNSWQPIALVATLISVSFSAIAYMLASAFQLEGIKRWAKAEFMYAFSTIFIVAMLLIFLEFMANAMIKLSEGIVQTTMPWIYQSYISELEKNGVAATFAIPLYYLDKIRNCVATTFVRTTFLALPIEALVTLTPKKTSTPLQYAGISMGTMLFGWFSNMLHSANWNIIYLLYSVDFQRHLLLFFAQTALFIFLPFGIILRTFPFTRGVGNLMIAVAIGGYAVYPLSYGIILGATQTPENIEKVCGIGRDEIQPSDYKKVFESVSTAISPFIPSKEIGEGLEKFGVFNKLSNPFQIGISNVIRWISFVTANSNIIEVYVNSIIKLTSELLLYAVFYPFVVAVITLTFIRSFAIFLGTDVQDFMQGLVRLV